MMREIVEQSYIEKIISADRNWRFRPKQMLEILKKYFENAESLTFQQYIQLRENLDKNYSRNIEGAVKRGELKRDEVEFLKKTFTDYLRDQHYRHLDLKKGIKIVKKEEEHIKRGRLKGRLKEFGNNLLYKLNWKSKDNCFYELERLLWTKETDLSLEKCLIDELPTAHLTKYRINLLERMIPRAHYKLQIQEIINKNKPKIGRNYGEVLEAA